MAIQKFLRMIVFAIAACTSQGAAASETAPPVRAEIEALLGRLEASDCQFNRNGSWYSAADAKAHLSRKLDYIGGRTDISNTERFIELAASRSSMSGEPYLVKCAGAQPLQSATWLLGQLHALRTSAPKTITPAK